jgi:choline dehydrogenase-like flavoprotein
MIWHSRSSTGSFRFVHGLNNLQVVDVDVLPDQPGSFVTLSIYMLVEKAAEDVIKSDLSVDHIDIGCR